MARTMTTREFTDYARAQILAAGQILARHRAAGTGVCACGRPLPCTVVVTCTQRCEHYACKLALVEQAQELLVVVVR